jgi:hypothetical protein
VARGDKDAVALAVKLAAARVRALGFAGSTPHLRRELADGTINLVHFQRSISGVTGREPAFTVNLNVVPAALLREWAAKGDRRAEEPIRSGADLGYYKRLGNLAFGRDYWWTPSDEEEATAAAHEVGALMETVGMDWLGEPTDPDNRKGA